MRKQSQKKNSKPVEDEATRIKYVNEEDISPHFFCPICQAIFTDPVFIECGHVYCRPCINIWVTAQHRCPECRHPSKVSNAKTCYIARQFIGDLLVHCINPGCTEICKLTLLEFHLKECSFNPKNLPEWLALNLSSWDGKDKESNETIRDSKDYVFKICQEKIKRGEIPDQQSIKLLQNLEFIEQDFKEIQAKRRQEDQAFLASFNHDNPREEIKQKPSTELVRSPLASPIAKKYFRKASPSPSSQPMESFNSIFAEIMDDDKPKRKPKKPIPKRENGEKAKLAQEEDDYRAALQLNKELNGEDFNDDFLTVQYQSKSNEAVLRPRKKI